MATLQKTNSKQSSIPDRRKYENDVNKISDLIKEKEKQIGLVNVDGKNYGEELTELGTEVESFEERRGRIMAEMKSIDEKLRQLGSEISKHKSDYNRLLVGLKYMTEDKYDDQIKKVESELQSGRYSAKDEKKLQNEIASLKEAKSKVSAFQAARKSVDNCRNEQDRLRKRKDTLHHQLKSVRERINSGKDKMNLCRQDLDRVREKQRERKLQQESISKEIHDLYNQRRQLHDEFRQQQLRYMEAMKTTETIDLNNDSHVTEKTPDELKNSREIKRKHIKSAKLSSSTDNGYEEDCAISRALLGYFSRLVDDRGTEEHLTVHSSPDSPQAPSSHGRESPDGLSVDTVSLEVPSLPESGYKVLRKKETEEEWLPSSVRRRDSMRKGRKKMRRENRKLIAKSQHKPIQLNAAIFDQLSRLGLRPPTSLPDVSNTIEELKQKLLVLESHRLSVIATDSEAGDSGIMSSTGISEYSNLTSGEVTPSRNEMSPFERDLSMGGASDNTPINSIDCHTQVTTDITTPTSVEDVDGPL